MKNNKKKKVVYVPMAIDIIHHGHINIINKAKSLGTVVVGLLTDEAIAGYKRVPLTTFEQRKIVIESIAGVDLVVPQHTLDFTANITKIKPDYFVHGDDWKTGIQADKRLKVIETLKTWGGKLVEPTYTADISSTILINNSSSRGTTPETRGKTLRRILQVKNFVRVLEVHNGLTGRIVEEIKVNKDSQSYGFDAMWLSSLTDSVAKGKPDNGAVDFTSRQNTIDQIFEVTTKPMIVDADNGGFPEHFAFMVRTLERLGVSAVIIEDKIGLKANSLFGTSANQTQDSVEDFSYKISVGKRAQVTDHFMIVARIESLILKQGMEDALKRSKAYIKAGADAILIHSSEKTPTEILAFCKEYRKIKNRVPLVVVPTTYASVSEDELKKAGVNIVIYANHLLRSAYPSMVKVAETILIDGSCANAESLCMPIKDILTLIPGNGGN